MINNDVSQGKERVKVPVVNELDDEKPSAFGVMWSQCDKGHWVHNDAVLEMFIFIPKNIVAIISTEILIFTYFQRMDLE